MSQCQVCLKDWDEAGMLFNCQVCKSDISYCQEHRSDHEHIIPEQVVVEDKPKEVISGIPKGKTIENMTIWKMPYAWTSGKEWKDLIIGSILLMILFGSSILVDFRALIQGEANAIDVPGILALKQFLTIGILVAISFIIHEMSHKYVAIAYGYDSRFVLNMLYVAISLITVLLGFFLQFLWVGAAMIVAKRGIGPEFGKIAGAGPFSNLVMGSAGILLYYLVQAADGLQVSISDVTMLFILRTFVYLNGFIGGFNMLPFGPLDGAKIWGWSKLNYVTLAVGLGSIWLFSFTMF